jgi:hypothetical protein
MTARHTRLTLSAPLAAAALAVALPALGAQAAGGGGFVAARAVSAPTHTTIPLETVRALVAAHHPDIIVGTSDANILILMIDSNGGYVGSAATKTTVVAASAGGAAGAGGVFAAAPTSAATTTAGARGAGGVAGGTMGAVAATAGGEGKMTFAGIGTVDANLVQDLFWNNYEAGEIGPNALRVRFVILKSGLPK